MINSGFLNVEIYVRDLDNLENKNKKQDNKITEYSKSVYKLLGATSATIVSLTESK